MGNSNHARSVGVALALALVAPATATRADGADTASWHTIVGLAQAGNMVGSGTGQVTGGGQPWSTLGGHATVQLASGHLHFRVAGLAFAGGNTVGTPLPVTAVKGTLVCDTDGSASGGNSVLVDTATVELDALGNAEFEGDLGTLPAVCASEPDLAFLIRIPAGRWIANGAVLRR